MKRRLIVSAPHRIGLVSDLTFLLGKAKINLEDIYVVKVGNKTIIDLVVSNVKKAKKVLSANGYEIIDSESILIQLEDKPGALSKVTKLLSDNKVMVHRIDVVEKGSGIAIVGLAVDKPKKTRRLLKDLLV